MSTDPSILLSATSTDESDLEIDDAEDLQDQPEDTRDAPAEGPPPTHPRFQKVYGRMKSLERELEERDNELRELRKLRQAAESRNSQDADPEPDIEADPKAYKEWTKRRLESTKAELASQISTEKLNLQMEMMRTVDEKFDSYMKRIVPDLKRDEALRNRIMGSANPPREAYKYAKQKEKAEQDGLDGLDMDGTDLSPPPARRRTVLSREEQRVARSFGMTDEEWIKQRAELERDRQRTIR